MQGAAPSALIEALEQALEAAKEGTLKECILSLVTDDGQSELLEGGHIFWNVAGNLDSIHSHCHVLAEHARRDLMGEG